MPPCRYILSWPFSAWLPAIRDQGFDTSGSRKARVNYTYWVICTHRYKVFIEMLSLCVSVFETRSLCVPVTHFVALNSQRVSASASRVLELKACTTMPGRGGLLELMRVPEWAFEGM